MNLVGHNGREVHGFRKTVTLNDTLASLMNSFQDLRWQGRSCRHKITQTFEVGPFSNTRQGSQKWRNCCCQRSRMTMKGVDEVERVKFSIQEAVPPAQQSCEESEFETVDMRDRQRARKNVGVRHPVVARDRQRIEHDRVMGLGDRLGSCS